MVAEKLIDKSAALSASPASLDQLLHPTLDPKQLNRPRQQGFPPRLRRIGKVVSPPKNAETMALEHKEKVILVRIEPHRRTFTACMPPGIFNRSRR